MNDFCPGAVLFNPLTPQIVNFCHKFKYIFRDETPVLHNRKELQDDTPDILDVPENT
jgi:hypothetical protein